ncbi:hypothetical protein ACFVT5_21295 [Streptomyces sp. NPDC058001]|uniref:Rv1733c family protein n=1 Tax=Streptomyces sp. NPDC058001 TaxID=3346300 RepID=UPI0036EAFA83
MTEPEPERREGSVGTRRGRLLWRWRRNPLRRTSDRAEAWLVLSTCALAVAGGAVAGVAASQAATASFDAQRASRHEVSAVLVTSAPPEVLGTAVGSQVRAQVRWTAQDGSVHTGTTRVWADTAAGEAVKVWTNHQDRLVSAPPTEVEGNMESAFTGVLAGLGVSGLVVLGGRLVRVPLDRMRLRQWETEWARVGPTWRRTTP